MGDIADMMIDGFLDTETGEVIDGDAPGHPRVMRRMRTKTRPFKCRDCGRTLATKQGLADHRRAKHEGRTR